MIRTPPIPWAAPAENRAVKRTPLSLGIILLAVLAIRAPLLGIPFDRDEGGYAYIAWRMGFHELPYRDWIDQKPPGIFWIYRLALDLPLDPIRAIHWMALLFCAASACALFFVARRFTTTFWAIMAAILFALLSADPLVEGTSANTELFMLLPVILSQLALFKAIERNQSVAISALLGGIATGTAIAFKQVAIVNLPLLAGAYWLFVEGPGRLRKVFTFTAWMAVGAAAPWLLIGGWFTSQHELAAMIYHVFTHNVGYVETLSWKERLESCAAALNAIYRSEALPWVFAAGGLASLGIARRFRPFLYLAGWGAASVAGICMSGYFFRHYFVQWLPPLCVAAALGAGAAESAGLWGSSPAWRRRAILALLFVLLPAIILAPFLLVLSPRQAAREIYPGNSLFAEMPALGKRIAECTSADQTVFLFAADPEVLFYAGRLSATRYIFLLPLYGSYADADSLQRKTADEVAASRPAAALYLPNEMFFSDGNDQYFTRWSKAYLKQGFHIDTYLAIDAYNIAHLVPASSSEVPELSKAGRFCGALFVRNSR